MKGIILGFLLLASPAFALDVTIEKSGTNIQPGHVAFIDIGNNSIVELDLNGQVVWKYNIPFLVTLGGDMSHGADIEWNSSTDTFLFVIPGKGIYEVNRNKEIVWSYKTSKVSHDADILPNNNILFVNGWDNKEDQTYTEIDRTGKIVETWRASDALADSDRRGAKEKTYSYTHANSVRRLKDGSTLVSMRNFDMYVIVKNSDVIYKSKKIRKVHDPLVTDRVVCYAPHHPDSLVCNDETIFSRRGDRSWAPLRTVEKLQNGNILLTGSTKIGQITPDGELVWSVNLNDFWFQMERKKDKRFIYKAVWVYH